MRTKLQVILSIVGLCGFASITSAAPFPGHLLLKPESGLFWLSQGFRLGTEGTPWLLDQETSYIDIIDEKIQSEASLESASYRYPGRETAKLRVEVEKLKGKISLEAYTKKWVRDYFQYGFHMLSSKPTNIRGTSSVVYDLLSKNKDVQIRQVIQVKHGKAVVLTCSDKKEAFKESLPACNQMAQNLVWVRPSSKDGEASSSLGPKLQD